MKVVAGRPDGLGTRLLTFMSARHLAHELSVPIVYTWPSLEDPLYTDKNLLQLEGLGEIFQERRVFSDRPDSRIDEQPPRLEGRVFHLSAHLHKDGGMSPAQIKALAEGYDVIFYNTPYCAVDLDTDVHGVFRRLWRLFSFDTRVVETYRAKTKDVGPAGFAAIHLRRGDVVKMLAESTEDFLVSRGFIQLFQRFLALDLAVKMIDRFVGKPLPIIVLSEDGSMAAKVASRCPDRSVSSTSGVFPQGGDQQALLDLLVLADASLLICPMISFFSDCAAKVGDLRRCSAEIDVGSIANELFPTLDHLPTAEANRRKALLLAHGWRSSTAYGLEHIENMRLAARLYSRDIEPVLAKLEAS